MVYRPSIDTYIGSKHVCKLFTGPFKPVLYNFHVDSAAYWVQPTQGGHLLLELSLPLLFQQI